MSNKLELENKNFFWRMSAGELPHPPVASLLGYKLRAWNERDESIEIEFFARPEFCNPVGKIHGGMLAAMLDETLAPLVASFLDVNEFAPTVNLNISYLRSADVGLIIGKGRLVKRGREVCFVEGQLYQDDAVIATATGSMLIRVKLLP